MWCVVHSTPSCVMVRGSPPYSIHVASTTTLFHKSGPEQGVLTKGVFSLWESLESLKSLELRKMVGFSFVFQSLGAL